MNKKIYIEAVVLVGLLLAIGFILSGCDTGNKCPGSGECTVTVEQGVSGLYVDTSMPQSSCGKSATYDYDLGRYTGGCKVQNNRDNRNRTYGKHSCDC